MVRMSKLFGVAAAALLVAGFICGPAYAAESAGSHPGSLLLFPFFSNEAGIDTFIRVTNTGPALVGFPGFTDVRVHFIFFYPVASPGSLPRCQRISSYQPLTPYDTLLTNSDYEAPGTTRGYFIAKATTPAFLGNSDIKWDNLVGDEIVVNTAEGWAWAINAIGILADQDAVVGAVVNTDPEAALLGEPEGFFGGADADAIEYEYINFAENFYFNYLTSRFGRPTDVVMIPLPRTANGTGFLGDDQTLITFASPPYAAAAAYQYDVTFWDADEREFSAPRDQVACWDVRSVNYLAGQDVAIFATRGFGWMNVFGYDNFGILTPTTQRALLLTLDRPSVIGITDAFAEWPTQDWTPLGNQQPPYLPTTVDISRF